MGKYDRTTVEPVPEEVATPPGVPRITVTPEPGRNKYDRTPPPTEAQKTAQEQSKQSWPAYLAQGAGDFVERGADMATFGMMPRIDAGIDVVTGRQPDYSTALAARTKRLENIRERSPYASFAGDVTGGVAGGVGAAGAKVGANIAGRLGAGPLGRVLGFGAEGAGVGAAQGAGHTYSGEAGDYLKAGGQGAGVGFALGGAAGTMVPKSAVQMRAGSPTTGQPIVQPTEAELRALSDRGYQVLSRIPVTYPGSHLQGTLSAAESQMITQNVAPEQAQTVMRIIERVRNHPGSISPAQIDGIRQTLNNMKNVPTPGAEKAGVAAAILRDALDDMIQNGSQAASNPQLARQAAEVVTRARGDRAAMFRSQQLTGPAQNAAMPAARGGPPVGEKLGPVSDKLLKWERGEQPNTRGWIPEERARVAAAVTPTLPERAFKFGANYFDRDIPALAGTKVVADWMRNRAAAGVENRWDAAAQAMRGRSPAYASRLQGAVPVAGPGMGTVGQGVVGAGVAEGGTPYNDGREALVPSMMNQLMY